MSRRAGRSSGSSSRGSSSRGRGASRVGGGGSRGPAESSRGSGASQSRGQGRPQNRAVYTGEEGRRQAEREKESISKRREESKNRTFEPFRFYMLPETEREIVVLDDDFGFFRYEHAVMNPDTGRADRYFPCLDHKNGCQICKQLDKNYPYYAMYASVIDLEGYESKSQGWVEWSRKMFLVKSGMQQRWFREVDRLKRDSPDAPLRGAVFRLFRDGTSDPKTGSDIEFIEYMDEDELKTYEREYEDRDRKVQVEDCSVPFDYMAIYPELTEQDIGSALNLRPSEPVAGSRRSQSQEPDYDDGAEAYEDEDPEYEEDGDLDEQWNEDEAYEGEEEAEGEEEEPPFDVDDPVDDEPKGRSRRTAGKPRTRSTAAEENDESGRRATSGSRRSAGGAARPRAKAAPRGNARNTRRR